MTRDDLLSLSLDDLASMTNRGTVKRAEKELAGGELKFEIQEGIDGHLLVIWSDGIKCEFQATGSVHEAMCSSGSVGISRHVIRSVLAYQLSKLSVATPLPTDAKATPREQMVAVSESLTDPENQSSNSREAPALQASVQMDTPGSWDPGEITDDALVDRYGTAAVRRARKRFEEGTLVELMRGNKPFASFLDENCFVRFMVRGDLRYVTADCSEATLSRFVAMAVWAFRELPKDKEVGLLSLQQSQPKVPVDLLNQLEALLVESTVHGIARTPKVLLNRLTRLEEAMRKDSLVWPAELLGELSHEIELYAQHDARFDPQQVVLLVGELIARSRAIHRNLTTVPQLLIRGSRFDRPIDISSGRYVGLGMSVRPGRSQTKLNVFFQDADTGTLATIERTFSNDSEKSFQELAESTLYRGTTLGGLAGSQMLLKSGKRLAGGELVLPRSISAFASNPQSFQWEQLKPPLAADDFRQLSSRWAYLPPSYLRPRRRTEGVHVVAIASVKNASFNAIQQRIEADLVDQSGKTAMLVLPFHSRGAIGFNRFLEALQNQGDSVRFISGFISMANQQLTMQPLAVVIESNGTRRAVFPYWSPDQETDPSKSKTASKVDDGGIPSKGQSERTCPLNQFFDRLCHFNGEVMLLGMEDGADANEHLATELCEEAKSVGFLRIANLIEQLLNEWTRRKNDIRHDTSNAVQLVHQLLLIGRMEAM